MVKSQTSGIRVADEDEDEIHVDINQAMMTGTNI